MTDIVNSGIEEALKQGVSNLHIEPVGATLRVRFRRDGMLTPYKDCQLELAMPTCNRLRTMAEADIAQRSRHQDGRICHGSTYSGTSLDIRASWTLRTAAGRPACWSVSLTTRSTPPVLPQREDRGELQGNLEAFRAARPQPHRARWALHFSIKTALQAALVLAQRLLRRNCPECRAPYLPPPTELIRIRPQHP